MQSIAQLLTNKKTLPDVETRENWLQMLLQAATQGYDLLKSSYNI